MLAPGSAGMPQRSRSVDLTQVTEWNDGQLRDQQDFLAVEEPLEICIGEHALSVTMRTPGHDLELANGFLLTEGFIERRDHIVAIAPAVRADGKDPGNVVRVELAPEVAPDFQKMRRHFFASSSCGICGKASIDAVRASALSFPNPHFRIAAETLLALPAALRREQDVFERTGGLHAAALFTGRGEMRVLREDIGRHNAVDKVIGWALAQGLVPLRDSVLLVSGRGGFEIVQKAIRAGVPVLASVSAPSGLAVQLARETRLTLVGFLRGRRFVMYAGKERIDARSP
ncbi:MAG: formate dehydrogenase accessory sulfurtransferase FdhD [Candidatus Binataceae bacterium]